MARLDVVTGSASSCFCATRAGTFERDSAASTLQLSEYCFILLEMIDKSQSAMANSNTMDNLRRRRSARLSSSPQDNVRAKDKMALAPAVKRSITVRKIAPRMTAAPSEHNKENTPGRPERECSQQKKQKVSTPGDDTGRGRSSSAKEKAVMPSPILPSTPPPPSHSQQPAAHPEDAVWSQKVRRSYSRLSDRSFNSPDSRETLFGFERLKTPEVMGQTKAAQSFSGSLSALNSFTLLEAEDCGSAFPEPDTNIPGVAVAKEKRRRRRRIQQIEESELDAMAAKMNAEFEEAEVFELVVE